MDKGTLLKIFLGPAAYSMQPTVSASVEDRSARVGVEMGAIGCAVTISHATASVAAELGSINATCALEVKVGIERNPTKTATVSRCGVMQLNSHAELAFSSLTWVD